MSSEAKATATESRAPDPRRQLEELIEQRHGGLLSALRSLPPAPDLQSGQLGAIDVLSSLESLRVLRRAGLEWARIHQTERGMLVSADANDLKLWPSSYSAWLIRQAEDELHDRPEQQWGLLKRGAQLGWYDRLSLEERPLMERLLLLGHPAVRAVTPEELPSWAHLKEPSDSPALRAPELSLLDQTIDPLTHSLGRYGREVRAQRPAHLLLLMMLALGLGLAWSGAREGWTLMIASCGGLMISGALVGWKLLQVTGHLTRAEALLRQWVNQSPARHLSRDQLTPPARP